MNTVPVAIGEKSAGNPATAGQGTGAFRYHAKFMAELEHDQMALLRKALDRARKESGLRERVELLVYMAKAYLTSEASGKFCTQGHCVHEGNEPGIGNFSGSGTENGHCPVQSRGANRRNDDGTPYRVTIHSFPGNTAAWVESDEGPRFVPGSTLSEALCDAEIIDLRTPGHREADLRPHERQEAGQQSPAPQAAGSGDAGPAAPDLLALSLPHGGDERHGPRLRRTIPLTLRRQVLERDGHRCTVPGCGNRRFLHIHHVDPLFNGGRDRAQNFTVCCSSCHRALHRGLLEVKGEAPFTLSWSGRWGAHLKNRHDMP